MFLIRLEELFHIKIALADHLLLLIRVVERPLYVVGLVLHIALALHIRAALALRPCRPCALALHVHAALALLLRAALVTLAALDVALAPHILAALALHPLHPGVSLPALDAPLALLFIAALAAAALHIHVGLVGTLHLNAATACIIGVPRRGTVFVGLLTAFATAIKMRAMATEGRR